MSIWTDYGFRDNPYSTKAIPPTREGLDLLVGRDAEARRLHRLITSSDTHPTIEGDNGVGKTSLVQVTAYAATRGAQTGRTNQVHLPLNEVFQVTGDIAPGDFVRQVCYAVVRGFEEHYDLTRGLGLSVPAIQDVSRWLQTPVYSTTGVSTPVGGGTRGMTATSSAGFNEDGFVATVTRWLRECFPSQEAGAFICVLDNLELLDTSAKARGFLEALRDTILNMPGLKWVLCGARGVVRGAVSSPRLHGVLGTPLELEPIKFDLVPEVVGRRIDAYAMSDDFFLPVDPQGFAHIYRILRRNLRDSLKLCEAFALEFDDQPHRPETPAERLALLQKWLPEQGLHYRKAAAGTINAAAWKVFDALVARDGPCNTGQFEEFGFPSPEPFRARLRELEKANLVFLVTDQADHRRREAHISATGWLIQHHQITRRRGRKPPGPASE